MQYATTLGFDTGDGDEFRRKSSPTQPAVLVEAVKDRPIIRIETRRISRQKIHQEGGLVLAC